jgi:hypothetical protein
LVLLQVLLLLLLLWSRLLGLQHRPCQQVAAAVCGGAAGSSPSIPGRFDGSLSPSCRSRPHSCCILITICFWCCTQGCWGHQHVCPIIIVHLIVLLRRRRLQQLLPMVLVFILPMLLLPLSCILLLGLLLPGLCMGFLLPLPLLGWGLRLLRPPTLLLCWCWLQAWVCLQQNLKLITLQQILLLQPLLLHSHAALQLLLPSLLPSPLLAYLRALHMLLLVLLGLLPACCWCNLLIRHADAN